MFCTSYSQQPIEIIQLQKRFEDCIGTGYTGYSYTGSKIMKEYNEKGYYFLGDFFAKTENKEKAVRIAIKKYKKFCRSKKAKDYFKDYENVRDYDYPDDKYSVKCTTPKELKENHIQKVDLAAVSRPGDHRIWKKSYSRTNFKTDNTITIRSYVDLVPHIKVFLFSYNPELAEFQKELNYICKKLLFNPASSLSDLK